MISACILGCEGTVLAPDERRFLADARPWGFILFGRNIETPDQVLRLTDALREAVGRDAPVLIDQEGGRVQRLRPPHWRDWPAPLAQVEAAEDPARAMWIRARLIADELRACGIDVNCAPTCDVARPETHPFLRNRCYGTTPDAVAAMARATADGLLAGGVLPVMKHMPGHGRGRVDSHLALPRVSVPRRDLEDDFAPFRALTDLPMGMTAHVVYDALGDRPGTLDPSVIWLIREEIGFDGLLMTDDLSMEALAGDMGARTSAAIAAGCDVALHCNGKRPEAEACVANCGPLAGDALRRADAALARRRLPELCSPDALAFELSEIAGHG